MTILFFPAISAALTVLHSTKCPNTLSISYYGLVQGKSVVSLRACAWRAGFCSAKYFNVLFFSVTKAQPQLKLACSQLRKSQCGGLSFNLAAVRKYLGVRLKGALLHPDTKLPSYVLLSHFTRHKLQTFSSSPFPHALKM